MRERVQCHYNNTYTKKTKTCTKYVHCIKNNMDSRHEHLQRVKKSDEKLFQSLVRAGRAVRERDSNIAYIYFKHTKENKQFGLNTESAFAMVMAEQCESEFNAQNIDIAARPSIFYRGACLLRFLIEALL